MLDLIFIIYFVRKQGEQDERLLRLVFTFKIRDKCTSKGNIDVRKLVDWKKSRLESSLWEVQALLLLLFGLSESRIP